MSRVGKKVIIVPSGCNVILEGNVVIVKGKNGELQYSWPSAFVDVKMEGDTISVTAKDVEGSAKYHGLVRTKISNMIIGVSDGYEKRLEIIGVGYKAQVQGKKLILNLGYSHPIEVLAPEGIVFSLDPEDKNLLIIQGFDKELLGQVASDIRIKRPPEPYKGKGIKYKGEHIIRKAGKSGAK